MAPDPVLSRGPLTAVGDGVRVALRVTPRAAREGVTGLAPTADGSQELKVAVTAVPEAGRANEAVIRLLARVWSLPRSSLAIVAGASDRHKILHVAGDPADLSHRLTALLPRGQP